MAVHAQKSMHAIAKIEQRQFPCCISGIDKKNDSLYYLVSDYQNKIYIASFDRSTKVMAVVDSVMTNVSVKSSFESVRLFDNNKKLLVAQEEDMPNGKVKAQVLTADLNSKVLNFKGEVLAAHYHNMRHNSGIESMSLSHDGKSLWVVNERPYDTGEFKGKVILESYAIPNSSAKAQESLEYPMDSGLTSAAKADNGVTEILLYNADSMLVMERAYDKDIRRVSVRIFWFNVNTKKKGLQPAFIADSLVLKGFVPDTDNYEGMCFGPDLDAKKTIFIISDNNANWNYDKLTKLPKQRTDVIWLKIE